MGAEENYKALRAELDKRLSADKRLAAIAEKISAGKADFSDTARYSQIASHIMGDVISQHIGEITVPLGKQMVCKELLRDHYKAINDILGEVQASVDDKLCIHLKPVKAPFPTERVDTAAHSLEDPTVPEETIMRRARSVTENIANSMHDDYIKENAKTRTQAGLKCYLVRDAGGGCCSWCQGLEGRFDYATAPDDIFRRHDNCTCTVTYECGRKRQQVWSKQDWSNNKEREYLKRLDAEKAAKRKALSDNSKPKVNTKEQAKAIELESSKLKTKYPETVVVRKDVLSPEYRRHFDEFGEDTNVTSVMCKQARDMLTHRSGTKFEDLAFIDSESGKCKVQKGFDKERAVKPTQAMKDMLKNNSPYSIIAIHNHPGSTVPSVDDLVLCNDNKYKYGVIACHNGNAFRYSVIGELNKSEDSLDYIDMLLDKTQNVLYNKSKLGEQYIPKLQEATKQLRECNIKLEVFIWE